MAKVKFAAEPSVHPQSALYDRYTYLSRIPHPVYAHALASLAEYLATSFFLFLALSGEQAAFAASSALATVNAVLYASLSYAIAFIAASWVFFRVTSGLFNPAVTVGMGIIGSLAWSRVLLIIAAQFLGAMTAAGLVSAIFPSDLSPNMQLGAGTSTARGFFIELFLTTCFVLMVFVIAGERHKHNAVVPFGLGFALMSVELSSVLYTGGSLNPARAFAVALASHRWPSYHWVYWLGPLLGSIPAGFLYNLVRALEHETADVKHREHVDSEAASPSDTLHSPKLDATGAPKQPTPASIRSDGHQLSAVQEHVA